jgi:hypothetical protein
MFVPSQTALLRAGPDHVTFLLALVLISNGVKFLTSLRSFVGHPSNEMAQSAAEQRATPLPFATVLPGVKLNCRTTLTACHENKILLIPTLCLLAGVN